MGKLGEQVGRFLAGVLRPVERAAAGPAAAPPGGAGTPVRPAGTASPAPSVARAEALLDGTSEQLGALAAATGQRLRRAAALAREEAEDIWAEAQQLRRERNGRPS